MGQHFLTDQQTVSRIVNAAALTPDDLVIEIGPGRGVLTRQLVKLVETVAAVELDPELCAQLPVRLGTPHNLVCVEADARTADFGALVPSGRDYKVVANLPYYAANPIIRNLLETVPRPSVLVVMVQKEVADSMVALPGRMGLLSVATQLYAEAQTVCIVPPEAFRPPPAVTSAVVKLVTRAAPAVAVDDGAEFVPSEFFDVVAGRVLSSPEATAKLLQPRPRHRFGRSLRCVGPGRHRRAAPRPDPGPCGMGAAIPGLARPAFP